MRLVLWVLLREALAAGAVVAQAAQRLGQAMRERMERPLLMSKTMARMVAMAAMAMEALAVLVVRVQQALSVMRRTL